MDTATVVAKMCVEELKAADFQAICRSRGFSAKAAASPKLFENLLLSEAGLAAVFGALTREEIVLLHLLKAHSRPVGLPFFERTYGARERAWGMSFTEKYRDTFKQVRTSLIRNGVLFFADTGEVIPNKRPRLERLLFVFPGEFHSLLPALFTEVQRRTGPGEVNDSALRGKLRELLSPFRSEMAPLNERRSALTIAGGELRMGEKELKARHLLEWQKAAWAEAIPKPEKKEKSAPWRQDLTETWSMDVVEAIVYAASSLGPNEWFEPASLVPILKVFCYRREVGESKEFCDELCSLGWQWGCLARAKAGDRICYRLPDQADAGVEKPQSWFLPHSNGHAVIDLTRIPLRRLEEVAGISRFVACAGGLDAQPDPVKIGRIVKNGGREPATLWVRENCAAFGRAFEKAEKKWGKQVVHEDLMVAEVQDLGLRVSIEKAFSERGLVSLPNGFLAFPLAIKPEVEALVMKNGYVVKRVTHNAPN